MAKDGTPEEAVAARRQFQKAAELMRHGPFRSKEFGFDSKMMQMMMHDLDRVLGIESEAEPEALSVEVPTPKTQRHKKERPE